jgi:hypothetical protein
MRIFVFILTLMFCITGCFDKKTCEINLNTNSYSGYGIIRFQKNFTGSIRYMEFYPFCADKLVNNNFDDVTELELKTGMILRETNSSKLWQNIISNKNINLNKDNYGLAIIFLKFHKKLKENKYVNSFDNNVYIKNKNIKIKMFDPESNQIMIDSFKIIKGVN